MKLFRPFIFVGLALILAACIFALINSIHPDFVVLGFITVGISIANIMVSKVMVNGIDRRTIEDEIFLCELWQSNAINLTLADGRTISQTRFKLMQDRDRSNAIYHEKKAKRNGQDTKTSTESGTAIGVKNNKFTFSGKRNFVKSEWAVPNQVGIHLNTVTFDPNVGPETILILCEEREFLNQLKQQGPFQLRLKAGAVKTSAGPIIFMLWWFPPLINNKPFARYELLVSPAFGSAEIGPLVQASRQTHLHLVILDEKQEIFAVVEFENNYELGRLVILASDIGSQLVGYDFNRAKRAFMLEIPQESLL
jgi:hypothetical protein